MIVRLRKKNLPLKIIWLLSARSVLKEKSVWLLVEQ